MESKTQLEARVLAYVEQIRSGRRIEDDLVECKRTWPDIGKAKQIAGLANKANGEPFLIIVGVDENAGHLVSPGNMDPANWWAGIRGKFDQDIWPDLIWHINISVDDEANQVTALLFSSDRAPYVTKTEGGGSPEREIPMRDSTSTRSATRRELIRLLAPVASLPSVVVISATATCVWQAERPISEHRKEHEPESVDIWANIGLYIEHTTTDHVSVIPEHLIKAELRFERWSAMLATSLNEDSDKERLSNSPWGVWSQRRQIVCSASGPASLHANGRFPPSAREEVEPAASILLRVTVGVAGSERLIVAESNLRPSPVDRYPVIESRREIGAWTFDVADS